MRVRINATATTPPPITTTTTTTTTRVVVVVVVIITYLVDGGDTGPPTQTGKLLDGVFVFVQHHHAFAEVVDMTEGAFDVDGFAHLKRGEGG